MTVLHAAGEVEFVTEDLPWAVVGRAYAPSPLDVRVSGRCPAGGVGFSVVSGVLPPGLQLSRLGYFSGTPKQTGQFEFTVKAVNGCSWTGRHFALVVTAAPRLVATPAKVSLVYPPVEDPAAPGHPGAMEPVAVHLVGTWPDLAYEVHVADGDWLTATPLRGAVSGDSVPRRIAQVHSDDISLRLNADGLKPGRYSARVMVTAWQAENVVIPVELTVSEAPAPTSP